jgi:hypothetical protein
MRRYDLPSMASKLIGPDSAVLTGKIQMSGSSKLTFGGITRSLFNRLRQKASKIGIHVVGPSGEAVKDGVRIQWNYDANSEQLEVQCIRAPFWVDSARINHDLRREIESTIGCDRAA